MTSASTISIKPSIFPIRDPRLAINGGPAAVSCAHPHEPWPPLSDAAEIAELASQRSRDINISGRAGPIAELEDAFLEFLEGDVKYVVSFNSGTSALLAAYVALGINEGDEVIGPALTYHAALSPLFILRACPVLADIDRNTRCLDPASVETLIGPRTRAITVVHQWGHPAEMGAILEIARGHNLLVLEDCSHAHGSRYGSRLCGTFGDVAVFSLQTAKMVYAGEGGILVTNNRYVHDRATLLGHYRERSHQEVIDTDLHQYWTTGFGLKLRMSPFNAIVAKYALAAYPKHKEARHACLRYFTERLRQFDFIDSHMPHSNVDMGAWYGFKPLYFPDRLKNLSRENFITALRAEEVEISIPSGPCLADLPLYERNDNPLFSGLQRAPSVRSSLSEARFVEAHAVSLPTFTRYPTDLTIIDQYIQAIQKLECAVKDSSYAEG